MSLDTYYAIVAASVLIPHAMVLKTVKDVKYIGAEVEAFKDHRKLSKRRTEYRSRGTME